ncbi:MAG: NAD(P)-dependent oxidoreductase [Spirochaetaceae bacterium]|nr:NAD(P)-dependent oxidoreductase [Spirochaetaceae bacterium]
MSNEARISFRDEEELEAFMSEPTPRVVESLRAYRGDIAILGIGGKIGVTLGMMVARSVAAAGTRSRVYGVSRFSDRDARRKLELSGVECLSCDLLDRDAVDALPDALRVIFMAGKKFGTSGAEETTWAMNTVVPANVSWRYRKSAIVAYSTGCVYDFVTPYSGGSSELDSPKAAGDYAQSALGRERVFQHASREHGTPVCLLRLNYAIDPRYGVLHDIARKVAAGEVIDLAVANLNCIWQGDVLERTILAFDRAASPAFVLNLTGPETASVRRIAEEFGRRFGKQPTFTGGGESGRAYLNDAGLSFRLFGYPRLTLSEMIGLQADWIIAGGGSLGKPTHFETNDGNY